MKKALTILALILASFTPDLRSQEATPPEIYLLTCGPGTETYSHYGHSALRIVIPESGSDLVYNWGVFDFSTKAFAWKFAKGRLEYNLGVNSYESFLSDYIFEERWVISQRVNLEENEIRELFSLITENLKPENVKYRYDFFYDDCSTRIRDLFEKAIGADLLYPVEFPEKELPTFRQLTGEFQAGYPWLNLGIDLLMGSPGEKKASFRDQMFLPLYLQSGLSSLEVRRDGKMIPLLRDPEVVVDLPNIVKKENFLASPVFIFTILLVIMIFLTAKFRGKTFNRILDTVVFLIFSVLAIMMIFFNFFTDHQQMKWNLNIIWLNPFIILCLVSLILNKDWRGWFRATFYLVAFYLAFIVILPQDLNQAFVPIAGILLLRTSVRSEFGWNPLTLPYLTEL